MGMSNVSRALGSTFKSCCSLSPVRVLAMSLFCRLSMVRVIAMSLFCRLSLVRVLAMPIIPVHVLPWLEIF